MAPCRLGSSTWPMTMAAAPHLSAAVWVDVLSWCVLRELAFQQATQQIGHGHALREGRHLDARPHGGCHVEGQASRVEVAFLKVGGIALANPRLGVWIRGRTCADADALACALAGWLVVAAAHDDHRSSSSTSAVISRAAALFGTVSRASRPAATLSANTMR